MDSLVCLELPSCSRAAHLVTQRSSATRTAAAPLRQHAGRHQLGRRSQRRCEEAAVELTSALGTAAAEASAVLQGSSSGSIPNSAHVGDKRLRVAVDVDEVLGRFLHSLNTFCHEAYGVQYEVADYWAYDFAKIWECAQDESNRRVHEFFKSRHFAAGIEAIPGAYEALVRLRSACDLAVVTSRQHVIQEPTLAWLDRHFPQVFTEVHFGNHFALEGTSKKKSEICRAIGAHVLVDDNPAYAVECAEAGIHVLLYDWHLGYPWSKTPEGPVHDRITRVRDWAEVEQVLGVLAAQRGA